MSKALLTLEAANSPRLAPSKYVARSHKALRYVRNH